MIVRDFLFRLHTGLSSLWERELFQRRVKLGLALAAPLLLIAGINLFFGSRDTSQAASRLSLANDRAQDTANLPFDFQFIGQGRITGGSDDVWIIGNVPIRMAEHTQIVSDLHVGDFVILSGRILQDKTWLADRIQSTQEDGTFFTFNGPLEWIQKSTWQIGGHSLSINQQTQVEENLKVDQILLTTFTAPQTNTWVALKIAAFDKFPEQSTPVSTEGLTPTPVPDEPAITLPTFTEIPASIGQPVTVGNGSDQKEGDRNNNKENQGGKGKGKSKGKGKGK
jgi:hypothetical protein